MAFDAGPVVGGVLLILFLCSVGCWAVIVFKFISLRQAMKQSNQFLELFWDATSFRAVLDQVEHLSHSPMARIFQAGYTEWRKSEQDEEERIARDTSGPDLALVHDGMESVERSLRRAAETEGTRMESMLIFLATVASAAPFIGLFGTVWGIMESFRDIGITGTANLAVVAPGISEALIATATGLAAAIPAVVAYNYFNNSIRVLATEMDAFVTEFLNVVSRKRSSGKVGNRRRGDRGGSE
jgi:biopolymer transport protein TolQ